MSGRRPGGSRRVRPRQAGSAARRLRWLVVGLVVVAGIVLVVTRSGVDDRIRQELFLPLRYESIIRQQANEKNVPADLIAAVINVESGFTDQTSSAGARGLMQITPDTADLIERLSGGQTFVTDDLSDPDINIRYGTFFLRELLTRYDGNVEAALAGYNAGPGNAEEWGGAALEVDDIEFPETRAYVESVLEKRKEYRSEYADELGL